MSYLNKASLAKLHRFVRVSIPQSWYDFEPLHSQLSLVTAEKPLVAWLVTTYVLAAVAFFGQVVAAVSEDGYATEESEDGDGGAPSTKKNK